MPILLRRPPKPRSGRLGRRRWMPYGVYTAPPPTGDLVRVRVGDSISSENDTYDGYANRSLPTAMCQHLEGMGGLRTVASVNAAFEGNRIQDYQNGGAYWATAIALADAANPTDIDFQIGTNNSADDTATFLSRYTSMLTDWHARYASARLWVHDIPDRFDGNPTNGESSYNVKNQAVHALANGTYILHGTQLGWSYTHTRRATLYQADDVHLNDLGIEMYAVSQAWAVSRWLYGYYPAVGDVRGGTPFGVDGTTGTQPAYTGTLSVGGGSAGGYVIGG